MSSNACNAGSRLTLAALTLAAILLLPSLSPAQSGTETGVDGLPAVSSSPQPKPPAQKAQSSNPTSRIRVQSILVTTPVTVMDRTGELISDLDEKDFKIYDNGVEQRMQRFEIASEPVALVILLQTDDSVSSLLYQVRPLGSEFSDLLLGPDGHAAVISFSDKVKVLQDFSNDRDHLKAVLGQLEAFGPKARLNDALMQAMALLESRPQSERRVIVAFSDGADHGSENNKADVIRRATADEVTIYGLHLSRTEALLRQPAPDQPMNPLDANVTRPTPPGTVPTPTNEANVWGTPIPGGPDLSAASEAIKGELFKMPLEYYAAFTGGVYYSHWSKVALQDQLNRIASEVHSQYEIAYVPGNLTENGFHRIEVEVARPNLKIRARAGYFYQSR